MPTASWPPVLLLQARGRVTAAEVAAELEVSERTARRDLDALGTAGIPVYASRGRGGWELLGGARTDLSGLSADEARALFTVAGPSAAASPELKAALRKLVRALPPRPSGQERRQPRRLSSSTRGPGGARSGLGAPPCTSTPSSARRSTGSVYGSATHAATAPPARGPWNRSGSS